MTRVATSSKHPLLWAIVAMDTPVSNALLAPRLKSASRVRCSTNLQRGAETRHRLGRALALQLLAQTGPGPWNVETTQRGKPIAIGKGGERHISISHTGSLVAAAVSIDGPIGIDIEWQNPARDFVGLATAAFGQSEVRAVAIEGLKAFYRTWTVREAISKATGKGLEEALDRIDRTPDALVDGAWAVSQGTWLIGHDVFNSDFSLALALQLSSDDATKAMIATPIASSRFEIECQ